MDKHIRNLLLAATAAACTIPSVATAEQGDWLIRAGVGMVAPTGDFKVDGGEGVTVKVEADDATSFVFDVTWMATDNLGLELLAAWPFEHDVKISALGVSIKPYSVEQLPPTLSLQWHFLPEGTFRPYVGAGISYVMFSNEKITANDFEGDVVDPIRVGDEFTWSLQAGMDIAVGDAWFVNVAVRYIDLTVTVETYDELGVYDKFDLPVDPFVYALNIGRKF